MSASDRDAVQQASDLVPGRDRVVEPVPAAAHRDYVQILIPRHMAERLASSDTVYACRLNWIDDDNVELVVTADPDLATRPAIASDLVGPGSKSTGRKDAE